MWLHHGEGIEARGRVCLRLQALLRATARRSRLRTASCRVGHGQNARQQMCLDGSYDTAWATFVATRLERASTKSREAHEKNRHNLVVAIMQEMSGAPPCSLRPKSRRAGDATWAGAVGEGGTINHRDQRRRTTNLPLHRVTPFERAAPCDCEKLVPLL